MLVQRGQLDQPGEPDLFGREHRDPDGRLPPERWHHRLGQHVHRSGHLTYTHGIQLGGLLRMLLPVDHRWLAGPGCIVHPERDTEPQRLLSSDPDRRDGQRQLLRRRQALHKPDRRGLFGLLNRLEPHGQLGRMERVEFFLLDFGNQVAFGNLHGQWQCSGILGLHRQRTRGNADRKLSTVLGLHLHAVLWCVGHMSVAGNTERSNDGLYAQRRQPERFDLLLHQRRSSEPQDAQLYPHSRNRPRSRNQGLRRRGLILPWRRGQDLRTIRIPHVVQQSWRNLLRPRQHLLRTDARSIWSALGGRGNRNLQGVLIENQTDTTATKDPLRRVFLVLRD